jgi:hypothetical protein
MSKSSRRIALSVALGSVLFATTVHAQTEISNAPPPELPSAPPPVRAYAARPGPQLGARFGYSFGTGIVYSGLSIHDSSHGALPIYIDLGWRFLPQLYGGIYGQFAPVFLADNPVSCPAGFDCSAQDWRFGVQADLHFIPHSRLDPYVGLGFGYEILHTHISGPIVVPSLAGPLPATASAGIIDRGWEFANLTLGFDARVSPEVGLGPFVSASLNQYGIHTGTQSATVQGVQVANGPVANVNHGFHELFIAGLRGTFNP